MNENESVLIISAIVNKENMNELQDYLGKIMQVFGQNGGKPVGRYKISESLSGDDSPEMVSIVSFPNEEAIKTMVQSEAFNALSELRSRVFSKLNLVIAGAA